MLNVGVIGLGEQNQTNLIPALMMVPFARLKAVCDIDESKLDTVAQTYDVNHIFTDYRKMIKAIDLDAVIIASTPQVHYEAATYLLENKKSLFIEKPPTLNKDRLLKLITLSKTHNSITGVGMNFSYAEPLLNIKEIISKPSFGNIQHIGITHYSNKPLEPFWNLNSVIDSFLLAQLIHPLDFLLHLGGQVKQIHTFSSLAKRPLFLEVVIEFENNIIGSIKSGTSSPHFIHKVEIVSDKSTIINANNLWDITVNTKDLSSNLIDNNKLWSATFNPSPLNSGFKRTGYYHELYSFCKSVVENTPFNPNLEHLLPVYNVLDEISKDLKLKFHE